MLKDNLLLSNETKDRKSYKECLDKTVKAILSSISDESAFSGIDPYLLRAKIADTELLRPDGVGFDETLRNVESLILPHLLRTWSTEYMPHLHSPSLLEGIAAELIIATFNDSMDSWDQGPAATEVEVRVIKALTDLFGLGEESDGTFTSGGSQSNISAIICHRDRYIAEHFNWDVKLKGLPVEFNKLRLYTSEISHFSMDKGCHILGLGYDAVRKLPVDSHCRVDIDQFKRMVSEDAKAGLYPFAAVATLGTTDFGSIDNVEKMREICDQYGMYLHADAAYGSGLIMSDRYRARLGAISLVDSITVDFHKMFLLPISCSALLVKDKRSLESFDLHADYLNREEDEEDGYINLVGKGMQTTRRFDALKVYMAFMSRGIKGYGEIIDKVVYNAEYLYKRVTESKVLEAAIKPELSSVVFRVKGSDELNKRIRRELLREGRVIGQTVKDGRTMLKFTLLNPRLNEKALDTLLAEIEELSVRLK